MEFTELEIKMFGEAVEITKGHKFEYGDWFGFPPGDDIKGYGVVTEATYNVKNVIWLPSQEQLQGMMGFDGLPIAKLGFIVEFAVRDPSVKEDWTVKQITLGAVMQKKYYKVWNGETWVKEG